MLIVADLSGIQEYLFQVREVGGKQARSLRFRSFFIQLVSEAIAIRLLHATGLQEKHIIISAAGKIAIDGSGLTRETLSHVHDEARTIELWLRDNTHARLRVNIICHDGRDASMPEQYLAAGHALRNSKLRGWSRIAASSDGWQSSALLATAPPDPDAEADRDAVLGRQLAQSSNRYIVFENSKTSHLTGENWDVAGLRARFMQHAPTTDTGHYARQLDRLARHVPRDNGEAIEFVDLAKRSRGAPMLAVLKADVDSLGQAITERLRNAANLEPLRNISNRLDNFFAHKLDRLMASDPQWKLLYTVFSGGDDLLLVGPWNTALDFAGHLHAQFMEQFRNDGLTLSAGVAIVKPKFPIRLAVQQAEQLLEQAKSGMKNQCAALGSLWSWKHHNTIIRAADRLAAWVDQGIAQRGWLHKILQLALLRRGKAGPEYASLHPTIATSRLAYHVGRNWPTKSDQPHGDQQQMQNDARAWIDAVLREFDQYESTHDVDTIHLPAIVRYAMLATRTGDSGESQ